MPDKENNIVKSEDVQENKTLEKVKEVIEKNKKKIVYGGTAFLLVSTNILSAKISGKISSKNSYAEGFSSGFEHGVNKVMKNASMLGKGLNSFKKRG
jgi:hypothetical protein